MFALGAREAVIAAVRGRDADCFGAPAAAAGGAGGAGVVRAPGSVEGISVRVTLRALEVREQVEAVERVRLVAHAHGWRAAGDTPRGAGTTSWSHPGLRRLRPDTRDTDRRRTSGQEERARQPSRDCRTAAQGTAAQGAPAQPADPRRVHHRRTRPPGQRRPTSTGRTSGSGRRQKANPSRSSASPSRRPGARRSRSRRSISRPRRTAPTTTRAAPRSTTRTRRPPSDITGPTSCPARSSARSTPPRTVPRSSVWSTVWSTATRSSGTTTPSRRARRPTSRFSRSATSSALTPTSWQPPGRRRTATSSRQGRTSR